MLLFGPSKELSFAGRQHRRSLPVTPAAERASLGSQSAFSSAHHLSLHLPFPGNRTVKEKETHEGKKVDLEMTVSLEAAVF